MCFHGRSSGYTLISDPKGSCVIERTPVGRRGKSGQVGAGRREKEGVRGEGREQGFEGVFKE